jgi:GNAT superfamily N-acetyltransferase
VLRRAKSVDIPFMVKGYEIGLRDGNFSESKMQINAFFANTTTHKNVHSYIYENNGAVAAYAILRKKDSARHEIMMMFVDPAQQGNGIGKKFLASLLAGPMKESPILCSTTQPASTRMMGLLKGAGFQRKVEAADGVYWEKSNGPGAVAAPAPKAAPAPAQPLSGMAPPPRLALPMTELLLPEPERPAAAAAVEPAAKARARLPAAYRPAPPPPQEPAPVVIDGVATEVAAPVDAAPVEPAVDNAPPSLPPPVVEPAPEAVPSPETLPALVAPEASPEAPTEAPAADAPAQEAAAALPKPPIDFSGKAKPLGYESRQQRARQLAKELFETLQANEAEPETTPVAVEAAPAVSPSDVNPAPVSSEEDIPLLATLNVVREKMGSLPGVKLPPLDRYRLMEINKKDLENMNVVELAALSAQLVKLAKDQLAEIDRLKVATQKRR